MKQTGSAAITDDLRHTVPSDPRRPLGALDRRLLRGAGLTGTVGSLLLLAVFVFVAALGLPDPFTPESLVRFPEIQYARAAVPALACVSGSGTANRCGATAGPGLHGLTPIQGVVAV